MDDPLEVRLKIPRVPLCAKVTPVAVTPLRYTELVAVMDHEAVLASMTVGVLKFIVRDWVPHCPSTAK